MRYGRNRIAGALALAFAVLILAMLIVQTVRVFWPYLLMALCLYVVGRVTVTRLRRR